MKPKRKSIVIYYALAIFLPCLILGILAFRGIKNDQALVEREQMRKLHETGQQIIHDTESFLLTLDKSFTEIIELTKIPQEPIFQDSLLHQFIIDNQVVAGIYYVSSGMPMLLNEGLLYQPDEFLHASDAEGSSPANNILENGWIYEFRETNYQKALEYYQDNLGNAISEQSAGELWNAIARVSKKLERDQDAINAYLHLYKNYPHIYLQDKIHLGAAALIENCFLYLKNEDTISALTTLNILLQHLEDSDWQLYRSQYLRFQSKIDEVIESCESSSSSETAILLLTSQSIRDTLSASEQHTEYLLKFFPNLPNSGIEDYDETDTHQWYKTRIDGESYFTIIQSGVHQGQWGIIMDPEQILQYTILPDLLAVENDLKLHWELTDAHGEMLFKTDYIPENIPPTYIVFPADLPSWSLTLYQEDPGWLAMLFRHEQGLFLYIFIVILIILACGLFFTLLTINNEIKLSRMKSNFISTVSHEFKSPLTSIRQMAEMLVHGRVSSKERKQTYYNTILQQSERLSHLIENILDFSKIEEGQKTFRFEKGDIVPVVTEVVDTFRKYSADQPFHFNLEISDSIPQFDFDHEAISQVTHNLIDNACKYSGDSRIIDVLLSSTGNMIELGIKDYGIGISKEDQDKIFSRFYRAGEELTKSVKGTGIGLTIVKQIVDTHQGVIVVESSPGKGSLFTIKLPLNQK